MCDKSELFLLCVWIVHHEAQGKDHIITSEVCLPPVLRYEGRRSRQNFGRHMLFAYRATQWLKGNAKCPLLYPWFGESPRIIILTVTFV